jgi:hypothetical protein
VEHWQTRQADIDMALQDSARMTATRLVFVGDSITDLWLLADDPWIPGRMHGERPGIPPCLTQSSSVCATQPIFGAMDSIAAHSDGYSPRFSCTIRTARSRTSGENLLDFFIYPSSQELEPPQNPGRFS